jgi:hypothetical protein
MNTFLRTMVLLLALLPAVAIDRVSAQTQESHLTGRVTDGSGGALPGVTVTIAAPHLATPLSATTDSLGQYSSAVLPPGTYSVAFELSGFETRTNGNIVVRPAEVFILDRDRG